MYALALSSDRPRICDFGEAAGCFQQKKREEKQSLRVCMGNLRRKLR